MASLKNGLGDVATHQSTVQGRDVAYYLVIKPSISYRLVCEQVLARVDVAWNVIRAVAEEAPVFLRYAS